MIVKCTNMNTEKTIYSKADAVKDTGAEDSIEMLNALIEGKRLKDISDLPLDLSV